VGGSCINRARFALGKTHSLPGLSAHARVRVFPDRSLVDWRRCRVAGCWAAGSSGIDRQRAKRTDQLSVTVDANGNQKDLKVVLEDPPGFRFGEAFRKIYARAKWIPGFRKGHPADCTFDYAVYFKLWYMGVERR
jgi:hypothetical protein